jgi:hypothetical protein
MVHHIGRGAFVVERGFGYRAVAMMARRNPPPIVECGARPNKPGEAIDPIDRQWQLRDEEQAQRNDASLRRYASRRPYLDALRSHAIRWGR